MLRFDLATREASVYPSPGPVRFPIADVHTVWGDWRDADKSQGEVWVGWDRADPAGGPIVVSTDPAHDLSSSVLYPTRAGMYDCAFGEWSVTPQGAERIAIDMDDDGCSAVVVDDLLLAGPADGLACSPWTVPRRRSN